MEYRKVKLKDAFDCSLGAIPSYVRGEHIFSYLSRIANANCCCSIKEFLSVFDLNSLNAGPGDLAKILHILDFNDKSIPFESTIYMNIYPFLSRENQALYIEYHMGMDSALNKNNILDSFSKLVCNNIAGKKLFGIEPVLVADVNPWRKSHKDFIEALVADKIDISIEDILKAVETRLKDTNNLPLLNKFNKLRLRIQDVLHYGDIYRDVELLLDIIEVSFVDYSDFRKEVLYVRNSEQSTFLSIIDQRFELASEFRGNYLWLKCLRCGEVFPITSYSIMNGFGCDECNNTIPTNNKIIFDAKFASELYLDGDKFHVDIDCDVLHRDLLVRKEYLNLENPMTCEEMETPIIQLMDDNRNIPITPHTIACTYHSSTDCVLNVMERLEKSSKIQRVFKYHWISNKTDTTLFDNIEDLFLFKDGFRVGIQIGPSLLRKLGMITTTISDSIIVMSPNKCNDHVTHIVRGKRIDIFYRDIPDIEYDWRIVAYLGTIWFNDMYDNAYSHKLPLLTNWIQNYITDINEISNYDFFPKWVIKASLQYLMRSA